MELVDRTRIEADWKCARKRYWLTEHEGTGIVPAITPVALNLGIAVHEGLEVLTEHDQGGAEAACLHLDTV